MKEQEIEKEKKKINWTIHKMINGNLIGKENTLSARFLLTFFSLNLREALKIKGSKFFWDNLKKNGFVDKKNRIIVENKKMDTMEFILILCGCEGYIQRATEEELSK